MTKFDHAVYWEDRLAKSDGLVGVGYMGLGQPFNTWMYRLRRAIFSHAVRSHVPDLRDKTVLDVGSGTGEYLRLWQQLGATHVQGSDLTVTAVQRLTKEFPGSDISQLDISEPSSALGPFDAISCMDVLFHVVDQERFEQAIWNLRSALVPGGLLFLSDHFVQCPPSTELHFTTRTLAEYSALMERVGLRILERKPMFHLMNLPADSRSPWLHRWWGMVIWVCGKSNFLGGLLGALLFPLEFCIVRTRREGVSIEIMVCTTA